MSIISSLRKLLGATLALVVVAALVAGCSSSSDKDKDPKKDGSTTSSTSTTKPDKQAAGVEEEIKDDPCALLDRKDLSEVTGIEFDASEPGKDSCIYTSTEGLAAIALNFTSLDGAEPTQALAQATTSCDKDTLVHLTFAKADGGFGCTVKGVATVGATGEGIFAVLTGATLEENVPTARILQDLATILEHAINGGR